MMMMMMICEIRLNMSISAFEMFKNQTIPHVKPNFKMCVSLYMLQLEKYAYHDMNKYASRIEFCCKYAPFGVGFYSVFWQKF